MPEQWFPVSAAEGPAQEAVESGQIEESSENGTPCPDIIDGLCIRRMNCKQSRGKERYKGRRPALRGEFPTYFTED